MTPSLSKLRQQMLEHMDDGDLRLVVFSLSERRNDLALRYENLGDTFNNRVLQLIVYCRTHRCVSDLIAALKETCPVVLAPPDPDPAWDVWAQGRDTAPVIGDDDPTPVVRPSSASNLPLLVGGIVLLLVIAIAAALLLNGNKPNPNLALLAPTNTPLLPPSTPSPPPPSLATSIPILATPASPSTIPLLLSATPTPPSVGASLPANSPVVITRIIIQTVAVPPTTAPPPTTAQATSTPHLPTAAPIAPSATPLPPTNPPLPPTDTALPPTATLVAAQPTCPPTPTGATMGTGIADFIYSHPDVVRSLGCLQEGETGAGAAFLEMEKGYVFCERDAYKRIFVFSYDGSSPQVKKYDIYPNECPATTPTPTPLPNDEPTPPPGLYMPTGTIGNFWINHHLRDTLGYAKTPDRDETAIAHVSFTNGRILWAHTNPIYCYVLYGLPDSIVGNWERYSCQG